MLFICDTVSLVSIIMLRLRNPIKISVSAFRTNPIPTILITVTAVFSGKAISNKPRIIDKTALVLIIIGAVNWGLIGLFKFDLVAALFGNMSVISRIVYSLVGISGLWGIKLLFDKD